MITLYGIPNCDTVKKARKWLDEHEVEYAFSDFKKAPPSIALIEQWLADIPLAVLLNKRGSTWRQLTADQQQQAADPNKVLPMLVTHPSLIKRPILAVGQQYYAGFDADIYTTIFS